MVMFLKAFVIAVFLYCTYAEQTHSTFEFSADFETQSEEWVTALLGDDETCPDCEAYGDEVEIVAEDPQHEALEETHSDVLEAGHGHLDAKSRSDLHICKHILKALREFEASHPQLRYLKKELRYKLRKYLPRFLEEIQRHKGDSSTIIVKFLDLLILLARSVKADCHHKPDVVPEVLPEPEYVPEPDYVPEPEYVEPEHLPEPVYPEPDVTYPEVHEPEPEYVPQPEYPVPDVPHPEYPEPEYIPKPEYPVYEPEYPEEHGHDIYEEVDLGTPISPGFVGSLRGIPGEHYPNYTEVPITSFSCADKKYIPGFYADLETGCQVFHVCYEHRRESFLCPLGTVFNQPILACDYWYSSNCSQAPLYYDVNDHPVPEPEQPKEEVVSTIGALITTVIEGEKPKMPPQEIEEVDLSGIVKFLPVKAKVTIFKKPFKTVVGSKVLNKIVPAVASIPVFVAPKLKPLPLAKVAVTKAKIAKAAAVIPAVKLAAAVPIVKVAKVAAAVPVAKFVVKAAAAPVVKAKFVKAAAIPVKAKVVAKAAIPVAKVAIKAASVPVKAKLFKVAAAKAAIPVVKVAAAKTAAVPIKSKFVAAAIPAVKIAAAKAAAAPAIKAKFVAAPIFASKVAAAKVVPFAKFAAMKTVPLAKAIPIGKFAATAALAKPKFVAASMAGVPIVKAKLAAVAISPLTKKALALGYMKLLKAKKLAVMG